ncbi:MAG TPA: B-box zinc finger protein [Bryobacteraceae bacterium]|nr:B-box zinc finger protein [Bryobacteraceae bacterium]
MNCQNHPDVPATAYCRSCGKPVCDTCRCDANGTVYCAEHAPAPAPPPAGPTGAWEPPPAGPTGAWAPPPAGPGPQFAPDISPGLAFFLGWIPGVGAIYNAQYAKGLVHAVIWGLLVSIVSSNAARGIEPVFGILIAVWEFYMAFEAYHTAQKRRSGEPVDEYSSLIDVSGRRGQLPVAPIALIVLGVVLLLHTLNLLDFYYIARYWPVLLIVAGAYLLYLRITAHGSARAEVRHERQ